MLFLKSSEIHFFIIPMLFRHSKETDGDRTVNTFSTQRDRFKLQRGARYLAGENLEVVWDEFSSLS